MNRTEYLLTCLMEECAEVAQRASKAIRFTLEEVQPGQAATNATRISQEIIDLYTVVSILREEGLIPRFTPRKQIEMMQAKAAKIEQYMKYSRERGALREDK